ncbi:MAG: DNA polymerase IV [Chloroflexi bacterium]|nr:DNA polymerase IV [Chloroflexota bacterium]
MTPHSWPRAILHLDMDAFYVNVYILDHAQDGDIPLVVGGRPDQRGVVASASYEARKLGIRSAMPTSHAMRLCPQLKIVPANWPRIRECSAEVMEILTAFGPLEQVSVDEAYLDLTEQTQPKEIAANIQTAVKEKTRLPCSVGLATSKLVAKIASDYDKPEGFTIITPGSEATFLAPLPTRAIWGIGPRTAKRLAEMGVQTCGQLAAIDSDLLEAELGRQAEALIHRAQGIDKRQVQVVRGPAKSISQEWTFSKDVSDPAILREQLQKMCSSVARSLQKRNLIAHTVTVKFRWDDFTTFTRQKSLAVGIDREAEIYHLASAIWQENWPGNPPLRLLGVGVSNLENPDVRQLGFNFENEP